MAHVDPLIYPLLLGALILGSLLHSGGGFLIRCLSILMFSSGRTERVFGNPDWDLVTCNYHPKKIGPSICKP